MPRNASGTYTLVAGNPVSTGTIIESDWANTTMPDLGAEMTDSLSRSGKGGMLAAMRGIQGSAAQPAMSFTDFTNNGFYAAAAGDMRLAIGGIDRMRWLTANAVAQQWDSVNSIWVDVDSAIVTNINDNMVINGGFDFWQRGVAFADLNTEYTADRWISTTVSGGSSTGTVSQEVFDAGQTEVGGQPTFYVRVDQTVAILLTYNPLETRIEDVRTLNGVPSTLSFYAKNSITKNLDIYMTQNFGGGGSAGAGAQLLGTIALTTSWQKFTFTTTLPNIAGETIGTNSFLRIFFQNTEQDINTLDVAQVKFEAGSGETSFTRAGNTLAGELAMCQRYYEKSYSENSYAGDVTNAGRIEAKVPSTDFASWGVYAFYKVTKRIAVAPIIYSPVTGAPGIIRIGATENAVSVANFNENGVFAKSAGAVSDVVNSNIIYHYTVDAEI